MQPTWFGKHCRPIHDETHNMNCVMKGGILLATLVCKLLQRSKLLQYCSISRNLSITSGLKLPSPEIWASGCLTFDRPRISTLHPSTAALPPSRKGTEGRKPLQRWASTTLRLLLYRTSRCCINMPQGRIAISLLSLREADCASSRIGNVKIAVSFTPQIFRSLLTLE